jgi:hypothetical protein
MIWVIWCLLCVYGLLDIYQTKMLLDLGAMELNPLMAWLMDWAGSWWPLLIVKVFFLGMLGVLIYMERRR